MYPYFLFCKMIYRYILPAAFVAVVALVSVSGFEFLSRYEQAQQRRALTTQIKEAAAPRAPSYEPVRRPARPAALTSAGEGRRERPGIGHKLARMRLQVTERFARLLLKIRGFSTEQSR